MGKVAADGQIGQPDDNGVSGHLGDDVLNAYLDHALDQRDRAEAATHLARCADCRRELAELRATARLLRGLPQYRPRQWLALTPERARTRRSGWFERLVPALPALQAATIVVALLLVVVGAGDVIMHMGGTSQAPAPAPAPASRARVPAAAAPSTGGTETGGATSNVVRAAVPNPKAARGASTAVGSGPGSAARVPGTAGAAGGGSAAPIGTAAARTGPETGSAGRAKPSRWRIAEVALGMVLLWLLVTLVGLRRVTRR